MDAYLWVTDEVLHQIRTLPSNDDDIKYAQGILKRIQKRDLYRLVGENKITWRDPEVHYNSIIYVGNIIVTKILTILSKIPYVVFLFSLANCPIRLLSPTPSRI